jgi:hypothetical protein
MRIGRRAALSYVIRSYATNSDAETAGNLATSIDTKKSSHKFVRKIASLDTTLKKQPKRWGGCNGEHII